MQFYRRRESGKIWWLRNPFFAALFLIRDYIVFLLPLKRLPRFVVKLLYGNNPKFIFFVHARRLEDIYVALPFLVILRRLVGRSLFLKLLYIFPPFVLDDIKTKQGTDGLVITSIFIPEILIKNKKVAFRESVRGLFLGAKIAQRGAIFGLGGLWPMLTRRGMALTRYSKAKDIVITNGHSGTLVSLFLTIKNLANRSNIPFSELKVVILGAGKMGTNLARALYGEIAALTLVDINEVRLNKVEEKLRETIAKTNIQKYNNRNDVGEIKNILMVNHIVVCTTSSVRRVLRPEQIPDNTIIIDDSRPEGISRKLNRDSVVVLEGGLMKIRGIKQNYDFGFGVDENVFGCLAESFLLSSDRTHVLSPTLGDVNFDNFRKMISICQSLDVTIGDFKSQSETIKSERLTAILKSKTDLRSTIPFKNICWLLKVEDLKF